MLVALRIDKLEVETVSDGHVYIFEYLGGK